MNSKKASLNKSASQLRRRALHKEALRTVRLAQSSQKKAAVSRQDLEWAVQTLSALFRKAGGRVKKETRSGLHVAFPAFPEVEAVVFSNLDKQVAKFWVTSVSGVSGWGWDEYKPGIPSAPSSKFKTDYLLENAKTKETALKHFKGFVDMVVHSLKRVRPLPKGGEITGVKERKDLSRASTGWSTNPNSSRRTHYEVLGTAGPEDEVLVIMWLTTNKKHLRPGRGNHGYGSSRTNHLEWSKREKAWLIVSDDEYSGG